MKKVYSLMGILGLLSFGAQAQYLRPELSTNAIESNAKARPSYTKNAAFWTNNFDNASDWTLEADDETHGWLITTDATGWSPTSKINSTSGGNYALFRNGNPTLPAGDPGRETTGVTYNMTTANPIDLTNLPNAAITYEVWGRRFTDDLELQVSTDGATFTTIDRLSSNIRSLTSAQPVNDLTNPTLRYALATAIGGQSQVWIRFRWASTDSRNIAYSYQVDDVSIIEAPAKELAITRVHFDYLAVQQSFAYREMPLAQAVNHEYTTGVFVANNGAATQTVTVTIVVKKDGNVVNTYTDNSTTILGGESDTIMIPLFTPTLTGRYDLEVNVAGSTADAETDPSNNDETDFFIITESTYADDAEEDELWSGSFYNAFGTAPSSYVPVSPAQVFEVNESGSTAYSLTTVFPTGTNPPSEGQDVLITLYQFNDPGAFASGFSTSDMTNVADFTHTLSADDIYSNANQKYTTLYFSVPAALSPGLYVATLEVYGGSDIYNMPIFAQSNADGSGALKGAIQNGASETSWTIYNNVSPFIKLNISDAYPTLGVNESKAMNFELGQNVPNPFNGTSTINFNLKENANVSINITDLSGKTVVSENLGNKTAGTHAYTVNASNLNAGIYFYSLNVNGKKITKKMVISE